MKRKYLYVLLTALLAMGCARTVTDKDVPGTELSMVISFTGTVDTFNNRYYIVFPKTSDLENTAPLNFSHPSYPLFAGPKRSMENTEFRSVLLNLFGELTEMGNDPVAYFFSSYFVNWYDYIEIRDQNVYLYKGAFPASGNAETNIDPGSPVTQISGIASDRLSFTIDLSLLSHSYTSGEQVYFYIITTTGEYELADWMATNIYSIENTSGTIQTGTDDDESFGTYEGTNLTNAINIKNWTLTVR